MLVVPMRTVTTVARKWFHSDEQIKDLIIQDFSGKRINTSACYSSQKRTLCGVSTNCQTRFL
jgi:7-cyano-7-deazaguanine synthase in queuosine biosynthesis